MAPDFSFPTAFGAGILSFLSPCVLPLVPPYLVFISGASLDDLRRDAASSRAIIPASLAFIAGFTTIFVLLGATASYAGQLLRAELPLLAKISGVFIILMGLNFLGVFKLDFLSREARYQQGAKPVGLFGAYATGLAFAFGWTPCIGPVLSTILSFAAAEASVAKGAILLAIYSLGLGVPFLAAALGINRFLRFFSVFKQRLGLVERITGGLMVIAGLLFLTGGLQSISYWLLNQFPSLQSIG